MNKIMHIDLETYSDVNIQKCGLYKYVQSPHFEIMLLAYAIDEEPVKLVKTSNGIPQEIVELLEDNRITKIAHNCAFEIACLKRYGVKIDRSAWKDTMVMAYSCGLPGALADVSKVLKFTPDKQKMKEGSALIKIFCIPHAPPKLRILPEDEPEKWEIFEKYCIKDVEVERDVYEKLKKYSPPESEWSLWQIDQEINENGFAVDKEFIDAAYELGNEAKADLLYNLEKITGCENPNSNTQFKEFLNRFIPNIESTSKDSLRDLLEAVHPEFLEKAIKLKLELGKTSLAKYESMRGSMSSDERIRGLLQFYGAARTGRWAGRIVQIHNLPRNNLENLELVREYVKQKDLENLEALGGLNTDLLSQLIRTAFIAPEGKKLIISDFSAIEARVLAWLAGDEKRLEIFRTHGKIYEATASNMYGVPIEKITKGNPEYALRAKGKIAELALGYQGGKGALIAMGALKGGVAESELQDIVDKYRNSSREIVTFWGNMNRAALQTVKTGAKTKVGPIKFSRDKSFLMAELPAGRKLYYPKPTIELNQFGRDAIFYKSLNSARQWVKTGTYGGKLTENVTQAVARDCLADAIKELNKEYKIVAHVHDEVIIEVDQKVTVEEAVEKMCKVPEWAEGLPLKAEGFESEYYKKD